jgi:Zn-dependent peptidase ImmA (M78 family)
VVHGFKSRAEQEAGRLRTELGLGDADTLNPFTLAEYLGVPVLPLQRMVAYGATSEAVDFFKGPGRSTFSATTITDPDGFSIVIYNDRHAAVRQMSNVCHELAHICLFHEPAVLVDAQGRRFWDAQREEEANWFGATLLVPRSGALALLDRGASSLEAAEHFGVSEQLFRWRVDQTGVSKQLRYRALARARRSAGSPAPRRAPIGR